MDGDLEDLKVDDLRYATEVGPAEIPGVHCDLSELSDAPNEEHLNPNVEFQQNICGLQDYAEMGTIYDEDKGKVSVDEDNQSQETT